MANFQAHINKAKSNLITLSNLNNKINPAWDWQVTCAYYTAVHLMNAHLAVKMNLHYKTHKDVKTAIYNSLMPTKVPNEIYLAYDKLGNLSRRARYLCNDDIMSNDDNIAYLTYDKHLKKALRNLDIILCFFEKEYSLTFDEMDIDCIEIKDNKLDHFRYKKAS